MPRFYTIIIFSNGSIWAESNECTFSTWCLNQNRNWPYETVDCSIQLELDHSINAHLIQMDKKKSIVPMVRQVLYLHLFFLLKYLFI